MCGLSVASRTLQIYNPDEDQSVASLCCLKILTDEWRFPEDKETGQPPHSRLALTSTVNGGLQISAF